MELNLTEHVVERTIAGRTLRISTGLMARQAAGSVVVQYGDTVVLSAVTCDTPRYADADFFPMTVDYREKTYAAGRFPGGFFKREKAPTTKETLTMRLTDRPIRPLFPKAFRSDVVIQSLVLSSDLENESDVLSMIGASAAIMMSSMPFDGPVGAVRMGLVNGELVVNPLISQMPKSELNLVIAGTSENVTMVEAGALGVPEERMIDALYEGHAICKEICEMQIELMNKAGRTQKDAPPVAEELACLDAVKAACAGRIETALRTPGKHERSQASRELRAQIIEEIATQEEGDGKPSVADVKAAFEDIRANSIRDMAKSGQRVDGRGTTDVRAIDVRVSVLPKTHGSALFTRGETQALATVTLGSENDSQRVDGLLPSVEHEKWYLHYQAPGFSVGESRMPRGPSRRDIGHGMLAQRALDAVMPHKNGFPYTVRCVSEILEMNGSSSMATVCGATLALMDAGVPITNPVAGIAMGLISEEGCDPVILTDILGDEDHCGDMDFKVCGTREGITALQMDLKVKGISPETMSKALSQAKEGRLHILGKIEDSMPTPREEINPLAPRIHAMSVDPEILGKIIGPGGKNIRKIQDESRSEVTLEDDGTVTICSPDGVALAACIEMIETISAVPEVGKDYDGVVKGVREFGAFVEILPGTEGLVHISELSDGFVDNIDDHVKIGDPMQVKVIELEATGKIRLSKKAAGNPDWTPPEPSASRGRGGDRGGRGGDRRPSPAGRGRGDRGPRRED